MRPNIFRFTFGSKAHLAEAEATLHLAVLAAEGLFGQARVRIDFAYHVATPRSTLIVDGCTPTGDAIVRVFTAFLVREFGEDGFAVRRVAPRTDSDRSRVRASHEPVAA